MKKIHIKRLQKRYLVPLLTIVMVVVYLLAAVGYFDVRLRIAHLPWPDNKHTYSFNSAAPNQKTFVALGDSLTYGFGADTYNDSYTYQVAQSLAVKNQGVTLKDYSYPGFTTHDVLGKLDAAIASKPDVVTVLIGVNDTHKLIQPAFAKNYEQILSRLSRETKAKIYVISIPYLGTPTVALPPTNLIYDARTKANNKQIQALARKYGADYIDTYTPTNALFKRGGAQYSKDSYHPSAVGYKVWVDIIELHTSR